MPPDIPPRNVDLDLDLDHVGYIVPDLQAAHDCIAALGFTLTTRAEHTRTDADGRLVSAGSAQHSLMLQQGYVEFMQIFDPSAGHQLAPAVRVRHGLHIVAFGTPDAERSHAHCASAGLSTGPVLHWARAVREPGIEGMAQFAYFGAAWQPEDPSYLCWVEHRTPQFLRSPQLVAHANGAQALEALRYRGPRRACEAWARQLVAAGARSTADHATGLALQLGAFHFHLDVDAQAPALRPSVLQIRFAGLHALRERCAALGLPMATRPDGMLDIDLGSRLGMHWHCRDATRA